MPKPRSDSGGKNLISDNLIELRHRHNLSQRDLAHELPHVAEYYDLPDTHKKGSVSAP